MQQVCELWNAVYAIYYLVETCNGNHTREYVWKKEQEEKPLIKDSIWKRGFKLLSRSGKRLIINHVGLSSGFLQDCGDCFVGKKYIRLPSWDACFPFQRMI